MAKKDPVRFVQLQAYVMFGLCFVFSIGGAVDDGPDDLLKAMGFSCLMLGAALGITHAALMSLRHQIKILTEKLESQG